MSSSPRSRQYFAERSGEAESADLLDTLEVQLLPFVRRQLAATSHNLPSVLEEAVRSLEAAGCHLSPSELVYLQRRLAPEKGEQAP